MVYAKKITVLYLFKDIVNLKRFRLYSSCIVNSIITIKLFIKLKIILVLTFNWNFRIYNVI